MNEETFAAQYFDGLSARARKVSLQFSAEGLLHLSGEDVDLRFSPEQVVAEDPLGSAPRFVRLPNDGYCVVAEQPGFDHALRVFRGAGKVSLHKWESSWRVAVLAVVLVVAAGWFGFQYGLPAACDVVAKRIPEEWLTKTSNGTLKAMDQLVFSPTQLSEERQQQLRERFAQFFSVIQQSPPPRVEFRASVVIGANALALPTGEIVFTDGLIQLAQDDEEIVAVLAHELGHVHHRHALRTLLQTSAGVTLLSLLTGDLSGPVALLGSFPELMMRLSYSRGFETEADRFAFEKLRQAKIDPLKLATLLERLSKQKGSDSEQWTRYLSTHPTTEARRRSLEPVK